MFLDFRERRSVGNEAHSLTLECICLFLNDGLKKLTTRGEENPHWSCGWTLDNQVTGNASGDDPLADLRAMTRSPTSVLTHRN